VLHVTRLHAFVHVPFESPFSRDHVVTGNAAIMMKHHVFSTFLPFPRDRILMGDAKLSFLRKTINNLFLEYSKFIYNLY
jgi:hypothetical protein